MTDKLTRQGNEPAEPTAPLAETKIGCAELRIKGTTQSIKGKLLVRSKKKKEKPSKQKMNF